MTSEPGQSVRVSISALPREPLSVGLARVPHPSVFIYCAVVPLDAPRLDIPRSAARDEHYPGPIHGREQIISSNQ